MSQLLHLPLALPTIGLGLAALGRPGYVNLGHAEDLQHNYQVEAMMQHTHQMLDEAWRSGIRYFDAARSYGQAEEFLGSWLQQRKIPPESVVVGSKWGYTYTANWQIQAEQHEVKEHSLPVLVRQWRETQHNLGGYVRLYQIHSATLESGVLSNRAVLAKLAELKQAGITLGLSLSGSNQAEVLQQALTLRIEGESLFSAVQATWNLLETSATAALATAHAQGWLVIVKEALANGRLTARNTAANFAPQLARLTQQATRLHTTIDALCLKAVLAQPWVTIVLSGAATISQLQSNLAAHAVQWDDEAAQQLYDLAEPPIRYWDTRRKLVWN